MSQSGRTKIMAESAAAMRAKTRALAHEIVTTCHAYNYANPESNHTERCNETTVKITALLAEAAGLATPPASGSPAGWNEAAAQWHDQQVHICAQEIDAAETDVDLDYYRQKKKFHQRCARDLRQISVGLSAGVPEGWQSARKAIRDETGHDPDEIALLMEMLARSADHYQNSHSETAAIARKAGFAIRTLVALAAAPMAQATEGDLRLARGIVASLPPFAMRTREVDEDAVEKIAKCIAPLRARIEVLERQVREEREACANVVMRYHLDWRKGEPGMLFEDIAEAIRNRSF